MNSILILPLDYLFEIPFSDQAGKNFISGKTDPEIEFMTASGIPEFMSALRAVLFILCPFLCALSPALPAVASFELRNPLVKEVAKAGAMSY